MLYSMSSLECPTSENLAAVLPRLPHHMEMITRTINGGYPRKLGVPLIEALLHDLTKFKRAIVRWAGQGNQSYLVETLSNLDRPLAMLLEYFSAPSTTTVSHEYAEMLVTFMYERRR